MCRTPSPSFAQLQLSCFLLPWVVPTLSPGVTRIEVTIKCNTQQQQKWFLEQINSNICTLSPIRMKNRDLAKWASLTSLSPKFSSASAILRKCNQISRLNLDSWIQLDFLEEFIFCCSMESRNYSGFYVYKKTHRGARRQTK